jgi:hypothetical protein
MAAVALCALAVCGAQAADQKGGRPIEFTAPRSDEITTNLNQLSSKRDTLKQLEGDLYQPLQSFNNNNSSLEGVTAPIPRRPAPALIDSKRAKDLLERRRNWVFMRPEDLVAEPTIEDILKVPDSGTGDRDKNDLGAMGQYYRRLANKQGAANRPGESADDDLFGPPKKPNPTDETAAQNDSNLPPGLKESAQALKKMFDIDKTGDPSARGVTHSSFADPFGVGVSTPTKEEVLEHKKFMDDYHTLVDPTWHPAAAPNPFNLPGGLSAAPQPVKNPASGFASSTSLAPHHGLDAQTDVLNPLLGPAGLQDLNARAVGQSRPALALPTFEAPKVVAPTFTAPKRSAF